MKKKGEFSFVWLFALIAGGMILFFAIYGAMKTGDTQNYLQNSKNAKELSTLIDPLQAGFASGSFGSIEFSQETRINNDCFEDVKNFGKNSLSVYSRSNIGGEWTREGVSEDVYNKYIFSERENTGKKYYIFSKQFNFPYEVADLILMTPDNYCFIQAPSNLEDEIKGIGIPNIEFDNCKLDNSIRVCFQNMGSSCDIKVGGCDTTSCTSGSVVKKDATIKYVGDLIYAAIFSDTTIYECNVKRLMYRTSKIAEILASKTELMNSRDCSSNMRVDLLGFADSSRSAGPNNLLSLYNMANQLQTRQNGEACGLWE